MIEGPYSVKMINGKHSYSLAQGLALNKVMPDKPLDIPESNRAGTGSQSVPRVETVVNEAQVSTRRPQWAWKRYQTPTFNVESVQRVSRYKTSFDHDLEPCEHDEGQRGLVYGKISEL